MIFRKAKMSDVEQMASLIRASCTAHFFEKLSCSGQKTSCQQQKCSHVSSENAL